jgi:hypothetical protein
MRPAPLMEFVPEVVGEPPRTVTVPPGLERDDVAALLDGVTVGITDLNFYRRVVVLRRAERVVVARVHFNHFGQPKCATVTESRPTGLWDEIVTSLTTAKTVRTSPSGPLGAPEGS